MPLLLTKSNQGRSRHSGNGRGEPRLTALRIVIALMLLTLVGQLFHLQIVKGGEYRERAEINRLRPVPVPASRGLIYDRQGKVLVENVPRFSAAVVPGDVPQDKAATIYRRLSSILGVPAGDIEKAVKQGQERAGAFTPVVIKENLPQEVAFTLKEELRDLPGARLRVDAQRRYPAGDYLSHILGYVGTISQEDLKQLKNQGYQINDQIGKSGLELAYEEYLRGQPGLQRVEVDATGRQLRVVETEPPRPGYSLILSLDLDLQARATKILQETSRGGAAAAIVMDVNTGGILALVSLPTYDNNRIARGVSDEELKALLEDPAKPLVNHAMSEMYPPGSIFKIITGVAALQEKVATPSTVITSRGYITVDNQFDPNVTYVLRDWAALGKLNFYSGVAMSSDVYFYCLAGGCSREGIEGLGAERLARYARAFGLGNTTGIDLPSESAGLVPDPDWKEKTFGPSDPWVVGDTYHFGIGQGFLTVTPLQMVTATAAIANGGTRLRPKLVQEVVDIDGKKLLSSQQEARSKVPVDKENLAIMREAMRQAVDWGTARTAKVQGITVAGKTGTAEFGQRRPDGSYPTHGWFVGFAPFDNPQVAIVVFHQLGNGAETAAPAAARILDYYFHREPPKEP